MAEFKITTREEITVVETKEYLVEAKTEDEALELVSEGIAGNPFLAKRELPKLSVVAFYKGDIPDAE